MSAALELGDSVGKVAACRALGVPRATLYRRMLPAVPPRVRPTPERALDAAERQAVLDHLHSERFCDKAPAEVYATLLDEGTYLCSIRTMHRILADNSELRERRDQLRHPQYTKPELLATGPNQVWSWDITKLLGPVKWTYFHLYVILDIFSRNVVGCGGARNGGVGQAVDRRHLRQARHRARHADHPCGSRNFDDFQAGGADAGRSGSYKNP